MIPLESHCMHVSMYSLELSVGWDKGYQCCFPVDKTGDHFYTLSSSVECLMISIFFFNLKKMLKCESLPSRLWGTESFSKSPNMDSTGLGLEMEQWFQQARDDNSNTEMSPAQGTQFCQGTDCPSAAGPQYVPLARPLVVATESWRSQYLSNIARKEGLDRSSNNGNLELPTVPTRRKPAEG